MTAEFTFSKRLVLRNTEALFSCLTYFCLISLFITFRHLLFQAKTHTAR